MQIVIHKLYMNEGSTIRTNKKYHQFVSISMLKIDKIRLISEQMKQFNHLTIFFP